MSAAAMKHLIRGAAAALLLALAGPAFGQANNANTWATPGNSTVGGYVNLLPNAAGIAVPDGNNIPPGTPVTGTATGTTASIAVTLSAAAAKTTYICGFTLSADATAATAGAATITGTVTGTLNLRQSVAAVATGTAQTQQTFSPCIPANAVNTAITVNSVAAGAGGNAAGYAWGFQF